MEAAAGRRAVEREQESDEVTHFSMKDFQGFFFSFLVLNCGGGGGGGKKADILFHYTIIIS